MNANFIVNEYALVWYLLFQSSFSESIYKVKQKVWETFKDKYNNAFTEKSDILEDPKNFIPNDDTIYNIFFENKDYQKLKKQVEKYRLEIMRIWDKNKKTTTTLYKDIIRKKISDYTFFVISSEHNIIDSMTDNTLVIGIPIDKKTQIECLLRINMTILNKNIKKFNEKDEKFKIAIMELAVLNEYASLIENRSYYISGSPELIELKRALYPYWLMYLGISKDEMPTRMMQDKISFDINKYAYEKELKKMNIEEFIDFCIRNQKYIVNEQRKIKVEDNEII